jgi:DNA-directed RNA polymerase specialized sigma24 family protein
MESETDAARLVELVGDVAAIMVLPAGARSFKRGWAALIPRGATVALRHDADEDGDAGAAKAASIIGGKTLRMRPPVEGGDRCDWDGERAEFLEVLAATARAESVESVLGSPLVLHDVHDTQALCRRIIQRAHLELTHYDEEDLHAYLVATCWELSPTTPAPWHSSFSGWVTPLLRLSIIDWKRKRHGRTRWQYASHTYERPRPQLVSIDELDPVRGFDAAGEGDREADRFASRGGLVAAGDGEAAGDLERIRELAARLPR